MARRVSAFMQNTGARRADGYRVSGGALAGHTSSVPGEESPELWPFVCPHCEQASNAVVRGRAYWQGDDGSQGPPLEWTLVQCDRCHEPTLQVREDFGGGFEDDSPATA